MSTTRSQKRKNAQWEADDNVSEGFVSPINMENSHPLDQNVELAGPSRPKSPRVENSLLESIRSSLNEEITSEIKTLLLESQKEMLKLLRPETRENMRDHVSEELESETRSFYTPTKTVRINSTQNEDPNIIRNNWGRTSCLERSRKGSGAFAGVSGHSWRIHSDDFVHGQSIVLGISNQRWQQRKDETLCNSDGLCAGDSKESVDISEVNCQWWKLRWHFHEGTG